MNQQQALLTAPIGATLFRTSAPNVIAMFILLATSMAEAWYVGQLGTAALAGLALGFPMYMLTNMLSAGAIGGAIGGAVAQRLGAGDRDGAEAVAFHAVILALILSALFAVIFLLGGSVIYSLLGGKGDVLRQALAYSDVLFAGVFILWLFNSLGSVIRGTGQMKAAALWMAVASVIQIVVGGLLILGIGPFPQLGLVGAAVAGLLAFGIGTVGQALYLFSGRAGIRLRLRGIPIERRYFAAILKVGLVASVGPVSSVGTIIVITGFAARVSDATLAGFGIGSRLEFLMIPLIFGIGATCITMIGVHFGAGEIDRGHRIGWTGGLASAAIAGTIGLVLAAFPFLWADLFSDSEVVRQACSAYLRIVGPTYAFFGLGLCLYFASQGAGRVFWPVVGNVTRFSIVLGGGLIMNAVAEITVEGLFTLVAVGIVTYGVIVAGSVKLGAWRSGLSLPAAEKQGAD